ncbi:MAG: 2Fe-2S iron-sulfur cluster-binding protein [Gemmatimonadota bacterium]|nr:2Fe-2S iron-sulfur cluster-binding protein [Gemmatimonadota bacterium]
MPKLTIDGSTHDVESGTRLVLAIKDSGINIGHRCGGNAHCTTCRVTFESGEPDKMTQAEKDILEENGIIGELRLSCQITCDQDMIVKTHMTLEIEPWDSSGDTPEPQITPDPEWV